VNLGKFFLLIDGRVTSNKIASALALAPGHLGLSAKSRP
jgi:hypothetical protein